MTCSHDVSIYMPNQNFSQLNIEVLDWPRWIYSTEQKKRRTQWQQQLFFYLGVKELFTTALPC